ncbi:MAG: hypothetical protein RI907_3536 [Pseudomonadota bacterium]|jgi:protein involved in polysaccharide export with SLBB domain
MNLRGPVDGLRRALSWPGVGAVVRATVVTLSLAAVGQSGVVWAAGQESAASSSGGDSASSASSSASGSESRFVQPVIKAGVPVVSPAQGGAKTGGAANGETGDPASAANGAAGVGAAAGNESGKSDGTKPLPLPPLPLNDFQRFVEESTGMRLPLFGLTLFEQAVAAYPSLLNVPVPTDYRLGPGDELMIRGWGSIVIDLQATVDRNGQIHIPRIGPVNMAGVPSNQAEGVVQAAVSRYYKDFRVSVTPGRLRGLNVYVVGQARKPGAYNLPSTATLISALFASGGPNQNGSMRHVQVKRGGRLVTEMDLYAFLSRGDKSSDVALQDGDTIVIPPATAQVALVGRVGQAAVYELANEQEPVGALVDLAGGLPVTADVKRVQLERIDPSQRPSRSVELLSLDTVGKARTLRNGDVLTVPSLIPDFGAVVTLRGNVAQPLRSPWRQGMTVRDLVPNRAALMSRASVVKQNKVFRAATSDQSGGSSNGLAQQIGDLVDEVNFDYAVVERVEAERLKVTLLPFNLGAALDDAASPDNLVLQPGDVVTIFSVKDVQVPQSKRQVYVRVEGEVLRPGVYQMFKGETLSDLLAKAGGPTADAYLYGAAFYREQVKQAQTDSLKQLVRKLESQVKSRLGSAAASTSSNDSAASLRIQAEADAQQAALDRLRSYQPTGRVMLGLAPTLSGSNPMPALRLEPQDRLVVPARPDFVSVLGAVNTETAMIWQAGKTVQDYLDQSGITSGAELDDVFVIRADGSVISDAGKWFARVKRADVLPGDVIVLPEKSDHESAWSVFTRNAKDITQIIYQFSLGAAAIKTLRQ